jgi:hypothetical protein
MNYVIYDKATNDVIGYGNVPFLKDLSAMETEQQGVLAVQFFNKKPSKVVNGLVVEKTSEEINQEIFPEEVLKAKHALNIKVTKARRMYITALPGQDAIYQAKENEATAYLAATDPVLADYPLLNAEVGITAATATELANLWITLAQQWRSVAAQLEAARMTANASIGSATTIAEVDAALATLDAAIANLS